MQVGKLQKSSLFALAALQGAQAHSWVEAVWQIDSKGAFTGDPGRPYGYIPRDSPSFNDAAVQNKITDTNGNPPVCRDVGSTYQEYDRLSAAAGDYLALQYQENGHVTQPDLTPRPYRGGNVYVYGTLESGEGMGINDVLNSWTPDGSGGNGKGQMLASHYFDDGQCYQNLGGDMSKTVYANRFNKYGASELFCQSDLQLPSDLPSSGKYTLMWVWDWPLIEDDTTNVTEIYSSCAEIDLADPSSGQQAAGLLDGILDHINFADDNPVTAAAIPSQLSTLIEATALGVGTSSPAAPAQTSPGGNNGGSAAPTPTGSSSAPAATTSDANNGDGESTVTVTVTDSAAEETTTVYHTTTVDPDEEEQQQATPISSPTPERETITETERITIYPTPTNLTPPGFTTTTTKPTATASSAAFTPSEILVSTVTGFLRERGRVTGAARRSASSYGGGSS